MAETKNLFEVATKNHYRFNVRGLISTEDLWDLSQKDLDELYRSLVKKRKESAEDSLFEKKDKADAELENKIQIVKFIFEKKVEDKEKRAARTARAEEKRKLLELLAEKQDTALKGLSEDELKAKLAALDEDEED